MQSPETQAEEKEMERGLSPASRKGAVELSPKQPSPLERQHGDFSQELRHIHTGEHIPQNMKIEMYVTEQAQLKVIVQEEEVASTFLTISL